MRRIRLRSDEGATLLLALIFMAVFAIILSALIPAVASGLTNSTVVRDFDARVYVADSGLDYAIQQLRWDSSLCPDSTDQTPTTFAAPSIDSRVTSTVTASCRTYQGSVNPL